MLQGVGCKDHTLLINCGNNFDTQASFGLLDAKCIFSSFNLTGIDFVSLGVWDLAAGIDNVKKMSRNSVADIVCLNIDEFLPYIRINRGAKKILLTSIIDPQLIKSSKIKDITASDPRSALKRLQQEISHDLFIVVIHAGEERKREILAGCSGIDLVIDGHKRGNSPKGEMVSGFPIVYNNQKGMYLTYVDILKSNTSKKRIIGPERIRVSVKVFKEDPQIVKLMSKYNEERRAIITRRVLEAQNQVKKVALIQEFPDFYTGSDWCAGCHKNIADNWRKSQHAEAMQSLINKERDHDPDCFKCHVTGFGDTHATGGFNPLRPDHSSNMVGVQCEACHGAGGKHATSNGSVKMPRLTVDSCLRCHDSSRDPEFNFETDFKKLNH